MCGTFRWPNGGFGMESPPARYSFGEVFDSGRCTTRAPANVSFPRCKDVHSVVVAPAFLPAICICFWKCQLDRRLFSNKRKYQRHGEPGHEDLLFKILAEIRDVIVPSIKIPIPPPKGNEGADAASTGQGTDAAAETPKTRGVSMVELALAWCMAQNGVTSVLMGARNATQVSREWASTCVSMNACCWW